MSENSDPVVRLSEGECRDRLSTQTLGRLITRVGDVVDVFPVNYVLDGDGILFRTAPGSKLLELTVNSGVLFEVDDHTDAEAWSVIVSGRAEVLEAEADVERAESLGLQPWIPTLKRVFVRISAEKMTGRAFERTAEPERTGVQDY